MRPARNGSELHRLPPQQDTDVESRRRSHIKNNAYKYQKKLDREIARIRRIQTLQQRGVALSGTAIASAMISLGTLVARVAYTYIFCTEGEPCNA